MALSFADGLSLEFQMSSPVVKPTVPDTTVSSLLRICLTVNLTYLFSDHVRIGTILTRSMLIKLTKKKKTHKEHVYNNSH